MEVDSLGHMVKEDISVADAYGRMNYRQADNINFLDGDQMSSIDFNEEIDDSTRTYGSNLMYQQKNLSDEDLYSETGWYTLVNDHSRVYKGGSWRDRAYYLAPGSRRFLDESKATDDIGFRCAMTRVGSPVAY